FAFPGRILRRIIGFLAVLPNGRLYVFLFVLGILFDGFLVRQIAILQGFDFLRNSLQDVLEMGRPVLHWRARQATARLKQRGLLGQHHQNTAEIGMTFFGVVFPGGFRAHRLPGRCGGKLGLLDHRPSASFKKGLNSPR
ncbi:MAG: hypothetical protein HY580_07605, partial [Nitrospinae bacterium]|nr:hypothetical protein [Nitrospinota bacterium]